MTAHFLPAKGTRALIIDQNEELETVEIYGITCLPRGVLQRRREPPPGDTQAGGHLRCGAQ